MKKLVAYKKRKRTIIAKKNGFFVKKNTKEAAWLPYFSIASLVFISTESDFLSR